MNKENVNQTFDIVGDVGSLKASGRYHIGPCPFCGGTDRFNVKHTDSGQWWHCRGCSDGRYQDAIAYLMQRDNLPFLDVVKRYGGPAVLPMPIKQQRPAARQPETFDGLGEGVLTAVNATSFNLWDDTGAAAFDYLQERRGLLPETIAAAMLGYNPDWLDIDGVKLPPGITIPNMIGGVIYYVNVRTTKAAQKSGLDKYHCLKGSRLKSLYGAFKLLRPAVDTAVVTEGEFDCLLLGQYLPETAATVTMGSAGSVPDNPAWLRYFAAVRRVVLIMDNDKAGGQGVKRWRDLLPSVSVLSVPDGMGDVTDFWQAGGDIVAWLNEAGITAVDPYGYEQQRQRLAKMPGRWIEWESGRLPDGRRFPLPGGLWVRKPDGGILARLTVGHLKQIKAWLAMLDGESVPDSALLA